MFHRKVHRFKPEDEELARDNPSLIEIIEEVSIFKQLNTKGWHHFPGCCSGRDASSKKKDVQNQA